METFRPPDQWQGRAVLSVCPARNGALWVGTEGAGLYRLQNGVWTNFDPAQGIRNPYVWSLAEDAQGELWAGTWGGGLFAQQGDAFRFRAGPGDNYGRRCRRCYAAAKAGFGSAPARACCAIRTGKADLVRAENVASGAARCARHRRGQPGHSLVRHGGRRPGPPGDGELIRRFRKADGLSSDFIECLRLDRDGALWIGTFGGGLNRFKQGRFAAINREQGLPNSVIGHIEEDGQGFFWMSSHGGIIRVSRAGIEPLRRR